MRPKTVDNETLFVAPPEPQGDRAYAGEVSRAILLWHRIFVIACARSLGQTSRATALARPIGGQGRP